MEDKNSPNPEEKHSADSKARKKSNKVLTYLVILFAVAFLLMLLSYLTTRRNSSIEVSELNQNHAEETAGFMDKVEELQDENEMLSSTVSGLSTKVDDLNGEISALEDEVGLLTEENEELKNNAEASEASTSVLLELEKAVREGDTDAARAAVEKAENMGSDFESGLNGSELEEWNNLKEISGQE